MLLKHLRRAMLERRISSGLSTPKLRRQGFTCLPPFLNILPVLPEWIDNVDDNGRRFSIAIVLSSPFWSVSFATAATLTIFSSHLLLQGLRWAGLYRFWSFEQTRVERDGGKQRDEVVVANLQCPFVRWEIFQVFSRCVR